MKHRLLRTNSLKHRLLRTNSLKHRLLRTNSLKHRLLRTNSLKHRLLRTNSLKHRLLRTNSLKHRLLRTNSLKHVLIRSHYLSLSNQVVVYNLSSRYPYPPTHILFLDTTVSRTDLYQFIDTFISDFVSSLEQILDFNKFVSSSVFKL